MNFLYAIPSPLDQFEIIPFLPLQIGNLYFSFTNPSFFMLLTLSLVLLLFYFITKKGGGKSVPNAWQSLVELIYDFVLNLVNEQMVEMLNKSFSLASLSFLLSCYFVICRVWYLIALQLQVIFSLLWVSHFPFLLV